MRPVALLASLAILMAACQATPEPSPSPTQAVAPSPTPTASATPTQKAFGGTLRVAISTPIGSLEPRAGDADPLLVGQVFEGLVQRGATGPAPALATKWLVAADGRTWTFTLRDEVVFHDGSVADGPAVAKSFARADDPIIEKASSTDARTVVLMTRTPYGPFLSALTTAPYAVVSPQTKLAGTGPFRLPLGGETARPLVLERNDRYWRADASGQRLPYLDRLSITSIPDPGTRLASIRAGNQDLILDLPISDIGTIRTDPSLQLVLRPDTSVVYLGLNLSSPGIDDLRVRQAIAMGLNARSVVDRLYGGAATPATQLPPPTMRGYDDSVAEFARTDAAGAKKLLTDSAHTLFQLDVWYQLAGPVTQPDMRRIAEAIAGDLGTAGFSADTKTIDPITFDVSVRENRFPSWLGLATAASFDPDELFSAFIPPVVNGVDQPTQGGSWSNPEVAGLLRKARTEPDQSKRSELYKQVSKIVQREVTRIPLVWSAPLAAATKKVIDPKGAFFAEIAIGK
ncbi:MAG: ABC transporter substrate-binding protein [Chloroflexota bacterium]